MNRIKSLLVWLTVPIMLAAWLLFGSRSLEPDAAPAQDPAAAPRYSLKGVEWTRLDAQGQMEFTAQSDSADYFDDESARYEQLRLNVVGISQTPWKLTSPKGTAPAHERRISMEGPVDVSGAWPDGEPVTLQTPQLWVDPVNKRLDTQAGVAFSSDSRSGKANGMKADWSKQTVQLLGNVKLEYVPAPR